MTSDNDYIDAPPQNYELTMVAVGRLTEAFKTGHGPQRDRVSDKGKDGYLKSLRARARMYGDKSQPFNGYDPAVFTPRVVWVRDDGSLWPLDGNGSNHWVESLFGPNFLVSSYFVRGLSDKEANDLFQKLQKSKSVTATEKFQNDLEYNPNSDAVKLNEILTGNGYHTTNLVKDPWGLGITTSNWVVKKYGLEGLADVLQVITSSWNADEENNWKRTNSALVKAVAIVLNNKDYDSKTLLSTFRATDVSTLADGARGAGGESIVLPRIRAAYDAALAQHSQVAA